MASVGRVKRLYSQTSVNSINDSEEMDDEKDEKRDEKSPLLAKQRQSLGQSSDYLSVNTEGAKPAIAKKSAVWKVFMFVVLWLAYLFVSAAYSVIAPFYPQEAKQLGVSSFIVGLIMGCSPLCVTVLSPIIGYFLPQFGPKFLMVGGVTLVGGCFVLLAFVIYMSPLNFIIFSCLLRAVEGVGSAMYFTSSFTVVAALFPSNLGFVMGLMELASGIGFAAGPPLGGLLYYAGGFKMPFLVTGCITLLFSPIFILTIPKTEAQKQSLPIGKLLKLMTNMSFAVIVLGNVIVIAALGYFNPTLSPFLIKEFPHLTQFFIGMIFLAGPGAYLVFSLVAGVLADKLGSRVFMCSGLIIAAVSFFFIGPAEFITPHSYLWLTILSFCFIGFGLAFGVVPVFSAMAQIAKEVHPDSDPQVLNGIVSGIISSTMSFGEFLGPIMGGTMTQFLDFKMASVVFGELILAEGFLLSGISIIDVLLKRKRQN